MRKVLVTIAGVVALGIVVLLVLAARKPDTFALQRSIVVDAPPEKIFPLIDDFRQWSLWSPYEHKDPAMKRTLGETAQGRGATYSWDGNSEVGGGRMTITEATPPSQVAIKLDMHQPLEASNDVRFTLVPQGHATQVTWAMQGSAPFISKVMQVLFDLDKMVGKDFEAGLAKLKVVAEK